MTTTAEPPVPAEPGALPAPPAGPPRHHSAVLDRAEGIELLGPVHGSGYREGAALVRRPDGQMVQLGPLMYALLEACDGRRDVGRVAEAMTEALGRRVGEDHVSRLAEKLAQQGLLAGTEHLAPPKANPLLALRWKVLVTNPRLTRRLTAPFGFLFHPLVMWPVLVAFFAVSWFVLIDKGVAGATAQAFHSPGLLLLVFGLAVISAGFHELGHAAACRYGGATPGGMGMGLYLVWPAFYTDVTDAYRLPRRARLRVDLAGLYFNAVVAVITMGVWLLWRVDALLLLVALQILQMVKQLSPVIRADGYHILSDATGIPDLYAQMGPTIKRLLPGHRHQKTALTGWARVLVTVWVLVMVPVLLSLMLSAVLLLPHLTTSAWDSARHIAGRVPHQAADGQVINLVASLLQLVALVLPVAGSVLITQKVVRMFVTKAMAWSRGRPVRRTLVGLITAAAVALLAWAWWPSGQYRPVQASEHGTLGGLVHLVASPAAAVRPAATASPVAISPGPHLAVAMIPTAGVSDRAPAVFIIPGAKGHQPTELVLGSHGQAGQTGVANAFPFALPSPPGPNGTQAVAVDTTDHGVSYDVAYAVVTVGGGQPVDETNSAYALSNCHQCTTVAVSFQVVLVVGSSRVVTPVNTAAALNRDCPACSTTAIADQIVVTLRSAPSPQLIQQLEAALSRLGDLSSLGAAGTPDAVASEVAAVQTQVDQVLNSSGQLAAQPTTSTTVVASSPSGPAGQATAGTTGPTPTTVAGVTPTTIEAGPTAPTAPTAPSTTTVTTVPTSATTVAPTTPTTTP